MSYTFTYTGNPISNSNPSAIGFRYSENTGGTRDSGSNWYYLAIPSGPYTGPDGNLITIQNGTYLLQASFIVNQSSNNYIYIIQNRTTTEAYYGGIINCDQFPNWNQGTEGNNFSPSFQNSNWTILSGNQVRNLPSNVGANVSTSAIFTYSNPPSSTTPDIIAAVCWYHSSPNLENNPSYITLTRIA